MLSVSLSKTFLSLSLKEYTDKISIDYGMSKIWVVRLSNLEESHYRYIITSKGQGSFVLSVNRQDSTY